MRFGQRFAAALLRLLIKWTRRRSALPLPEIAPLHLKSLPGPWLGGERSWVEGSDLTGARLLIYFTRTAAGLVAHGEGGQPSMDHRDGGNSFPDILASFRNLRWI